MEKRLNICKTLSDDDFCLFFNALQDYKQQRPSQELVAKDLHGVWNGNFAMFIEVSETEKLSGWLHFFDYE